MEWTSATSMSAGKRQLDRSGDVTEKLEMPIEQFAEAVAKENARLRAILESIAEGGMGDTLEDAYDDVRRQAREALK